MSDVEIVDPGPARDVVSPFGRLTGSSLIVNVSDFERVVAFYRDVLHLPVRKRWDTAAGSGMIVELGPASSVEFSGPPYGERADPVAARGVELMVGVDDAAAWRDRLVAAGVAIRRELIDNPWGDRSFGVDDPDGRRVWIYEVVDAGADVR